ncbi:MAG: hypothetical protein AAB466_09340, partial [Verrucomicrobiota bacterium]
MSQGAVKVAVHRLRHRYRELWREEIADTVANAAEIKEEIRPLFTAFGQGGFKQRSAGSLPARFSV